MHIAGPSSANEMGDSPPASEGPAPKGPTLMDEDSPFKILWKSPLTGIEQRVYDELYAESSPRRNNEAEKRERVVVDLMFWPPTRSLTTRSLAPAPRQKVRIHSFIRAPLIPRARHLRPQSTPTTPTGPLRPPPLPSHSTRATLQCPLRRPQLPPHPIPSHRQCSNANCAPSPSLWRRHPNADRDVTTHLIHLFSRPPARMQPHPHTRTHAFTTTSATRPPCS